MCQYKSGIAVKSGDDVKVYYLKDSDSHSEIRKHYNIVDDDSIRAGYQTPVELIPVRGIKKIEDFNFVFDDARPEWWTETMTESAARQLFLAHMENTDGVTLSVGGDLYLSSLTSITEGVTLSAGRNLDLRSLTSIPEGVTLSAGRDLSLGSLTSIPEGVTLSAGGHLDLRSLTSITEGVTLSAGGNLDLSSLTSITEGVKTKAKKIILAE